MSFEFFLKNGKLTRLPLLIIVCIAMTADADGDSVARHNHIHNQQLQPSQDPRPSSILQAVGGDTVRATRTQL